MLVCLWLSLSPSVCVCVRVCVCISLCVCMPISRSVCSSECLFCCVSVLLTISVNATQNEITSLDERIFSEHHDYRDRLGFCRYQTIALVYSNVIVTIFSSEINILGSHVQLYRPNGCAHEYASIYDSMLMNVRTDRHTTHTHTLTHTHTHTCICICICICICNMHMYMYNELSITL